MIITRTPFRVSFAGGGSDIREFYARNGYGAAISAAIKRYMYLIIHPYFHEKIRIKYSQTEDVDDIDEIKHPIVRECLRRVRIQSGIEIASFADVPAGTGLGSSSSFTVGLLNALYAYKGEAVSKERLAQEACEIEIDVCAEPIGKQDQYAAAYGGVNYFRFNSDESVEVTPLSLSTGVETALSDRLSLYYTGGNRLSTTILAEQRRVIVEGESFSMVREMIDCANDINGIFGGVDIDGLGKVLHKCWLIKRGICEGITNVNIDGLYKRALELGATGGKLLGAGGAGFLLLYSRNHETLRDRLGCRYFPFEIDKDGSKIIFNDK